MPEKRLIADELETSEGEYCALGVLGKARGLDMKNLDPEDSDAVGKAFDIAPQLAREIVYMNDEVWCQTDEQRFEQMRSWVAKQIDSPNN